MNTPHAPDVEHHKTGYWWFVMAITGGLSLTFNLWMAIDPPKGISAGQVATNLVLGVIAHASPVLLSALVSHGFKTPLLGRWERRIIVGLFLVFMLMSISTQAGLLEAGAHLHWLWSWVRPAAIDTIALLALRAILTAHRLNKEAAKARDIAAERAAVALDLRPDSEADIRREFEGQMPAIQRDITVAVWRDIWRDIGVDNPTDIGVDTSRNLPALVELVQEDILRRKEAEFAAQDRDMAQKWSLERVDLEDQIRAEEQEAAMLRWQQQEETLASQIEFRLRRELRSGSGSAGRRAIPAAKDAAPKVSKEKGLEIVRQALADGDQLTNEELAQMIGASTKTVGRYKKELRAEMGLAPDDADDLDADEDGGASGRGALRAV